MKSISNSSLLELANELKNHLSNISDCFKTINIIVPDDRISQFLKMYLLKNSNSVLMGFNILGLEEALLKYINHKECSNLKRKQLRSILLKKLIMSDNKLFSKEIKNYLYDDKKDLDGIKLYDLADTLSKLFFKYENNDVSIIGFQKELYELSMKELEKKGFSTFNYLYSNYGFIDKIEDDLIFFGFNQSNKIYKNIVNVLDGKCNLSTFFLIENNTNIDTNSIKLYSAPSKTREIEYVHSAICSLLKDNKVNLSDIIILSPNINAYESIIAKVFNQDGINFPNIPYSINKKEESSSDVTMGLKKLFEISNKKFFTRLDFVQLINNKTIQKARHLEQKDVDNFQKLIIQMNVYRDREQYDDWEYAKKRLILSKVSNINAVNENVVELKDGKYTPFSNIELDDESIVKFIDIIDDIKIFKNTFNENKNLNETMFDIFKEQLEKWFSIKNEYGDEENEVYLKLALELYFWQYFDLNKCKIPINSFSYTLLDISSQNKSQTSDMFFNGVTFTYYDETAILNAKYLFFIGLNSKEFPIVEQNIEIDLSKDSFDIEASYKYFKMQCQNANYVNLSYVNQNLKTDETYYPSTFIIKLLNKNVDELKEITNNINIDETRNWSDIYTRKSSKEKEYFIGLFSDKKNTNKKNAIKEINIELLKSLTVSKMRDFLLEPLKYKFEYIYGTQNDISSILKDQYEKLEIDSLTIHKISNKILLSFLKKHSDDASLDEINKLLEIDIIEHNIPTFINQKILKMKLKEIIDNVHESYNDIVNITNNDYSVRKLPDYQFIYNNTKITLISNNEFCFCQKNNIRTYIEISNISKNDDLYKLLSIYIISLIDVATLNDVNNYKIELYKGEKCKTSFYINSKKAQELIFDIYKEMNTYDLNAYMPFNLLNNENVKFIDLKKDAFDYGITWKYFNDKNLFDPNKDLGYTEDNFDNTFKIMNEKIKSLILFISQSKEKTCNLLI